MKAIIYPCALIVLFSWCSCDQLKMDLLKSRKTFEITPEFQQNCAMIAAKIAGLLCGTMISTSGIANFLILDSADDDIERSKILITTSIAMALGMGSLYVSKMVIWHIHKFLEIDKNQVKYINNEFNNFLQAGFASPLITSYIIYTLFNKTSKY